MSRKITRGSTDFTSLFESLTLPTSTIRLCMDADLVAEREKAQSDLDAAKAKTPEQRKAPADASMADASPSDPDVLQDVLDEIDERIDASDATTVLEVRAPSETDMLTLQPLYDDDKMGEWQVGIVAACLDQPAEAVEELREHVTRGTWRHLWTQCVALVSDGAAAVPTRPRGSGKSPA